jgi:hypothetical protein
MLAFGRAFRLGGRIRPAVTGALDRIDGQAVAIGQDSIFRILASPERRPVEEANRLASFSSESTVPDAAHVAIEGVSPKRRFPSALPHSWAMAAVSRSLARPARTSRSLRLRPKISAIARSTDRGHDPPISLRIKARNRG